VPGRGEAAHVKPALGDQHLRGAHRHPGDRAQQLDDPLVWSEQLLDLLVQHRDRVIERVDVRDQLGDDDPMMVNLEAALERLSELRNLRAHPALRQLRQRLGLAHTGEQRLQHRPRGLRPRLRRDARELDPGVLEHLLDPLDRADPLVDLLLAKPGQIPEPAGLRRRHEARPHEPMRDQLADPLRVLHIRFPPGDIAKVLSI
jgi:hypothetical protein